MGEDTTPQRGPPQVIMRIKYSGPGDWEMKVPYEQKPKEK